MLHHHMAVVDRVGLTANVPEPFVAAAMQFNFITQTVIEELYYVLGNTLAL
jgi:hypothetical protein